MTLSIRDLAVGTETYAFYAEPNVMYVRAIYTLASIMYCADVSDKTALKDETQLDPAATVIAAPYTRPCYIPLLPRLHPHSNCLKFPTSRGHQTQSCTYQTNHTKGHKKKRSDSISDKTAKRINWNLEQPVQFHYYQHIISIQRRDQIASRKKVFFQKTNMKQLFIIGLFIIYTRWAYVNNMRCSF
jgi:hypothetical protein